MNFLCPACKTPLPVATPVVIACSQCGVEVDLTRVDTAPGQAKLWPEVDLAGETLGSFKLVSRAGSGGMGTVYVADGLAGRAAVKVLSAQLAADPSLRERFRREAQALRKVQHAGVVHIIDEGTQNGFCWYAMEHVEGKDLRARIAEGPLPHAEVEALARELLDALAAVHEAGLVHRDLKPGNILLSSTGARLCDFGIARFDGATTLTESAALLGSLRYMAPEQRAGITTPKSDLYSLGLVLHEAATGGLPGEKEPPGGRLGRLIDQLLQASPAKRPIDARAAAKLVAVRKPARVGAAALVVSSVLGVGAFAAWAVLAGGLFTPRTTATDGPPPPAPIVPTPVAKAQEPPDAGPPPVARLPRVIPERIEAYGISEELVAKLVQEHLVEIKACYEDALAVTPELKGRLTIRADFAGVKGRAAPPLARLLLGGSKLEKPRPEPKPTADELEAPAPKKPVAKKKAPGKAPDVEPEPVVAPRPTRVAVGESTLANAALEDCVMTNVRRWQFPSPTRPPAYVNLVWSFDQLTEAELIPVVRAAADARAENGLDDPREPLPALSTGRGPGKPVKVLRTDDLLGTKAPTKQTKPAPPNYVAQVKERLGEIDGALARGELTDEAAQAARLEAIDQRIAAIGEPTDGALEKQRFMLEDLRKKLGRGSGKRK